MHGNHDFSPGICSSGRWISESICLLHRGGNASLTDCSACRHRPHREAFIHSVLDEVQSQKEAPFPVRSRAAHTCKQTHTKTLSIDEPLHALPCCKANNCDYCMCPALDVSKHITSGVTFPGHDTIKWLKMYRGKKKWLAWMDGMVVSHAFTRKWGQC